MLFSPVENGGHVRKGYSREDFGRLLLEYGCRIIAEDYCAGYFTQTATSVERFILNTFFSESDDRIRKGIQALIFIALFPFILLDPLVPYPPQDILVVAEKA